jgi:hypothetical protein
MKYLKLAAALLIGFLLGTTFRPSVTHAGGGSVFVKKADIEGFTVAPGSNVVGFSCVASGDGVQCYIASQ